MRNKKTRAILINSLSAIATLSLGPSAGIAAGDRAAGQQFFATHCSPCHATEPGLNKIGPSLSGVVGRKSGSEPGYQTDGRVVEMLSEHQCQGWRGLRPGQAFVDASRPWKDTASEATGAGGGNRGPEGRGLDHGHFRRNDVSQIAFAGWVLVR
jgi:hypothetical protein